MRCSFKRRAIALALALFLVLTMAPSMAAPAEAADTLTLSIKVQEEGTEWPLVANSGKVTLEAAWSGGDVPTTGVRYQWESSNESVMTIAPLGTTTAVATPVGSGDAVITLTATQTINGTRTQIGTATFEVSVTSLVIKVNGVTAESPAQLVVGQGEATLQAGWSNGTPGGIAKDKIGYKWECGKNSAAVSWSEANIDKDTVTIQAASSVEEDTTAHITVTASWPVEEEEEEPPEEATPGEKPSTQSTTCELDVEVIKPRLGGIEILIGSKVTTGSADLVVGGKAELEAIWVNDIRPSGAVTYTWQCTKNGDAISFDGNITTGNTVNVTANKLEAEKLPREVQIKVTATWGEDPGETATATCTLTVNPVAAESITLSQDMLTLSVGGKETLTATVLPEDASSKEIKWTSSNEAVATVTDGGVVEAIGVGQAVITATSGTAKATCTVYVTAAAPTIAISGSTTIVFTSSTTNWNLTAMPSNLPEGASKEIRWSVSYFESGREKYTKLPQFKDSAGNPQTTGRGETVTIVSNGAGDFIFKVEAVVDGKVVASASKRVTISGIVLTGTLLDADGNLKMYVGGNAILTVEAFGEADNGDIVEWSSSDPLVVNVLYDAGSLTAWGIGKAIVSAAKGDYQADCTVEVGEDTSVIAGPYTTYNGKSISTSNPLILGMIANDLNTIAQKKTAEMNNGIASNLKYITNLNVSTSQGTLYYNYSTESDTGGGVGYNDQFAATANGSVRSLDRLYFVPKQGFSGTAEITFNAVAVSGQNFAGVIRIEVGKDVNNPGSMTYQISYRARAGEPAHFLSEDFNTYCQRHPNSGRSFNFITFNLPKASEGVLYYDYVAGTGNPVSTTMQFTQSGRYTIDDVCFVPNAGFEGTVTISFRAVDTAGDIVNGTLTVEVTAASSANDVSSVTITGERGQPVTLQNELFNAASKATINDTLSFVIFRLPDQTEGTLFYNYRSDGTYDSRVTATTRYYYSGVPSLSGVTFLPTTSAAGRIAISYTGYGVGGASFNGTLYISMEDVDRSVIHYSVAKNSSVTFSTSDFNNAGLYAVGSNVSYVLFTKVTGTDLGSMYYNTTTRVNPSSTRYYISPTGVNRALGRVYFVAGNKAGTVTISYTAYNSDGKSLFDGTVEIQIGALTPEDIHLSCKVGGQAQLTVSAVNAVCSTVMNGSVSYIEITSLPDAKEGHLYFNYSGFGTGKAVEQGERFYRVGSPGIGQLTFIPFARFTGEAEITYIGYSSDGLEQVSGRILVNVTKSTASQYFNDMGSYAWAVDSVDYLLRNGTVIGEGGGRYNPSGTIKRGDFTLMLVRAYGLTANGSASFSDVPANKYYAKAIQIAAQLGIVSGSYGKFYPEDALTRQDAMVMIYNTLKATGKTTTNGLTADLSVYYDEGQIASYAREAMGTLVQMGVIEGDGNGYLRPQSKLNRAEAAILLHTIMTL